MFSLILDQNHDPYGKSAQKHWEDICLTSFIVICPQSHLESSNKLISSRPEWTVGGYPKFSGTYVPIVLRPQGHKFAGSYFPSTYIPHISSAVHMFPPKVLCFQGPIIPGSYVPHIYVTGTGDTTMSAMFPSSTYVISLGHKFRGSYFFL